MLPRIALILLLLTAQMLPVAAATLASAGGSAREQFAMNVTEVHRAICGEFCCCAPESCSCMESQPPCGNDQSPAPFAPPLRLENPRIDLLLPQLARAMLHHLARRADVTPQQSSRCANNQSGSIHALLGIWLT